MSQALYRKYRSRSLDEVLGQDHVTGILSRALKQGKIAHAYLLTGPRGTGKTSIARILAHEINQLPYSDESAHLDIIEIDAASNNGVDDIRNLREKARIAPVLAKYKIYIIDEVHMLSKAAFNALLKTLEEPPEHVIFILATTDADKLPATILSRVQQYFFHPISTPIIAAHLQDIAKKEGFAINADAATLIAEHSRGGFRDSISLLDQLSSLASKKEPLTREQVASSLGLSDESYITQLLDAYDKSDTQAILQIVQKLEEQGANPRITTTQLLSHLRTKLATHPAYIRLMHELIEVTKHPHPDLKLLTILLSPAAGTTTPVSSAAVTTDARPQPVTPVAKKPTSISLQAVATTQKSPKKAVEVDTIQPQQTSKPAIATDQFNWQNILDEAKTQSMGLFSLLARCDHDYADGTLVLHAGTSFAQKMLDDAKNRPLIGQIVQKVAGDATVVIKNGKKPPQDEELAAVAAIMGGGEEVNLEEVS